MPSVPETDASILSRGKGENGVDSGTKKFQERAKRALDREKCPALMEGKQEANSRTGDSKKSSGAVSRGNCSDAVY